MGFFGKVKKGLVFVVSAPAGAGKTTLVEMIVSKHPNSVVRSVSCTTRNPRKDEVNGVEYIFLSQKEFEEKKNQNLFLEDAQVFDKMYGTLQETVESLQNKGKHVILVIDTQGAMNVRKKIPCILIFIKPPSIEELKKRLEHRGTESDKERAIRLSWADDEMKKSKDYDVVIVNDDLQKAYNELELFLQMKEKELCSYQVSTGEP